MALRSAGATPLQGSTREYDSTGLDVAAIRVRPPHVFYVRASSTAEKTPNAVASIRKFTHELHQTSTRPLVRGATPSSFCLPGSGWQDRRDSSSHASGSTPNRANGGWCYHLVRNASRSSMGSDRRADWCKESGPGARTTPGQGRGQRPEFVPDGDVPVVPGAVERDTPPDPCAPLGVVGTLEACWGAVGEGVDEEEPLALGFFAHPKATSDKLSAAAKRPSVWRLLTGGSPSSAWASIL